MSELTLTVLRLSLLVLLWLFVFSLAAVLRGDLFGTRVVNRVTTTGGASGSLAATVPRDRRSSNGNILVTSGRLTGTRIPLGTGDILIGRNPECLLVLDDDFASGRHARIFPAQGGWGVEDLGSTNGTFVNDVRIEEPVQFEPGAQLRIGRTTIELQK